MNTPSEWILIGGVLIFFCIIMVFFFYQRMNKLQKIISERDEQLKSYFKLEMSDRFLQAGQQQYQHFDVFQKQLAGLKTDVIEQLGRFKSDVITKVNQVESTTDKQLDQMRYIVDEKLNKTLEERLGKSFQLVNHSLVEVQKGLGEMQHLATGVGDLKKVLTNVKTRGVMGEIQLANILEQVLTSEQYGINVATIPNSSNHVEFAIKFPGPDHDKTIWLPVDSKFPLDIYEKLLDAYEDGELTVIENQQKVLMRTVKRMAQEIRDKYISPPYTTDFGVLFLPVEGLYAELARDGALITSLQRDMKIMIAGPSNLAAFLNALRMGFRTLAIEKRSGEVWKILNEVRNEFWKFGEILAKTQKKIQEAGNVIEKARGKSTTISRRLSKVEKLPDKTTVEDII